ncbi:hypothetical protein F2Q70_00013289 [Brassica cretica]|uniref:RRM domain-containing protein n=1 Tax=Brassica cretica TaxID=69181 RepID=A0A8S9MBE4_BRACR|nr:hypothetical protein F2Q70_00013289 [Brassica cretica]
MTKNHELEITNPSLLPSYLLPSPSISTRSPLPSPSLPPRLASSVTSRLLTTPQSKKTASSLMTTLLPQSFPSDLKLFVGNLPFNVDSAQVAQLFESAGNVEMAELCLSFLCDVFFSKQTDNHDCLIRVSLVVTCRGESMLV